MPTGTTERLLRRTRRRLFAMTMGLLTLLVVGIGAATAVVALRALHDDVDRAVVDAVQVRADTARGENAGGEGGPAGENGGDGTAPADGDAGTDPDRPTGLSDTFVLVLDTTGKVVENRSSYPMAGLPDTSAIAVAAAGARDLRTITVGGVDIRLYTVPIVHDGTTLGFVQGGIRLTLLEHETQTLILGIASVGAVGLVGAALITLLVTGRALRPVRDGFETQRRFVADASHELRTPLAIMRTELDVALAAGGLPPEAVEVLESEREEVERMSLIVADLLALARFDEGSQCLESAPVALHEIAASAVEGRRPLAEAHGVRLDSSLAPATVTGDAACLAQVVTNLVDNAIEHGGDGCVVTVSLEVRDGRAVLTVADTGPGIPAADLPHVFERFYRADASRARATGGSGLGLSIVKETVEAHGGTVSASSVPGRGATFTVRLTAG